MVRTAWRLVYEPCPQWARQEPQVQVVAYSFRVEAEAEWRRCVKDEQYFLENYWHIAHPARGRAV